MRPDEPRVLFWNAVWVTPADAARLQTDAMVHGNCYVVVTNDAPPSKPTGRRIDPRDVNPAARLQ